MFDPDVGCANPNAMRDKRILELKAKHNFYVMPTFNNNNLRLHTKRYQADFDDTLTIYSGGGYIAKSKLGSTYSKRKTGPKVGGSRRSITGSRRQNKARRFNEQLDNVSQKSVSRRSAIARSSHLGRRKVANRHFIRSAQQTREIEESKENIKKKILDKLEKMSEAEIDKVSKQLDEITKGDEELAKEVENPEDGLEREDTFDREEEDVVADLPSPANFAENKSISELSECATKHKDLRSRSSKTSKTYISHLKHELEAEKAQRMKLEEEIENLKKISSEISSRLGLTPGKKN